MSLLPKSRIGTGMSLLLKQHGGGQAPALRAKGMTRNSRRRERPVSMHGCFTGRRDLPVSIFHPIGTRMSLLPKQHGGGQAPALRANGNAFFS